MSGDEWIDRLLSEISDSEVLVCFANYFHFRCFGENDTRLVDLVCQKIRNGCAVLLQSDMYSKRISSQELPSSIRDVFKCVGAEPLPYQVHSETCIEEGQLHQRTCWFDQTSLRDRVLFKNVSRVTSYVPSLIAYNHQGHPIIDVEPPDYSFTDPSDLEWEGSLGMRHSIAVVCDSFDSIQIVLGGRIFDDYAQWGFGDSDPLFENNVQFAHNLLEEINSSAPTTERYRSDAWTSIVKLELAMGELLEKAIGKDKLMANLPNEIKDDMLEYFGEIKYSQLYFRQLGFLIRSHYWEELGPLFAGTSRKQLKDLLYKINSGPRRFLAHPIKSKEEDFQLDAKTVDLVETALTILKTAIQRLEKNRNAM